MEVHDLASASSPIVSLRSGSDEAHVIMGCSTSKTSSSTLTTSPSSMSTPPLTAKKAHPPVGLRSGSDDFDNMDTVDPGPLCRSLSSKDVDVTMLDSSIITQSFVEEITRQLRNVPHKNALSSPYQGGGPSRVLLETNQIPWNASLSNYSPETYHAPILLRVPKFPWADNVDTSGIIFNTMDHACQHDRSSHEGNYEIMDGNLPMNPRGRTGLAGRGLLGRYGPNHAADPVATKWRRGPDGKVVFDSAGKPVLEFVAIKRKDTGDWAIPGGMVDPGENISVTLKREFGEETMASMELSFDEQKQLRMCLDEVFKDGVQIYSGYVDDIRNTDNAWMETVCVNFHDNTGETFEKFKLAAGDDAGDVAWLPYTEDIKLYATHAAFLDTIYRMRLALHADSL